MKTHIINGHYMFGNTFIQPDLPMYDTIHHHNEAPIFRHMPPPFPRPPYPDMCHRPDCCPEGKPGSCLCYEDNTTRIDTPYEDPNDTNKDGCKCDKCECDCELCKIGIIRDPLIYNIINIETSIVKSIKVTLYGIKEEMDKTFDMKVGNRYAITYVTEQGLITSIGYLELISDSVPDECTRYINAGANMAAASTAYIGMDCSTEGHSDKRKIYIATIRYIQELESGETPDTPEVKSLRERLQKLLDAIDNGELVFCNHKNDNCCSNKSDSLDNDNKKDNTDESNGD